MTEPVPAPRPQPASAWALFLAFNRMAAQAFGGVLPVAQHELVARQRWLDEAEFVELLALAQLLPGGNVLNLALMVGERFHGLRGALAAMAGLLALPLAVVLLLAAAQGAWAELPAVAGAMRGMGAVAAGLATAAALRLLPALRRHPLGPIGTGALALAAFVAIGVLRLPLVAVLVVLGAAATALAWWRLEAS